MTIYASRTAESFDPKPMVSLQTNVRHARDEWCDTSYCVYRPRPEFTPKTAHRVNPILTEFREALKDWGDESPEGNGPRAEAAQRWLHYTVEGNFGFDFTGEHIEHARRVLTRLATLKGDN